MDQKSWQTEKRLATGVVDHVPNIKAGILQMNWRTTARCHVKVTRTYTGCGLAIWPGHLTKGPSFLQFQRISRGYIVRSLTDQ